MFIRREGKLERGGRQITVCGDERLIRNLNSGNIVSLLTGRVY